MKQLIILTSILFLSIQGYSQTVGEQAPGFTLDLLGGGEFTLSDHAGKVVLIFFFGNTCPYCIASGPSIQEIYEMYMSEEEFTTVGLDTWNSTSSSTSVTGFKSSTGITFPLALSAGSVSTAYGTTYDRLAVIDKAGLLRHKGTTVAINDVVTARNLISVLLEEDISTAVNLYSDDHVMMVHQTSDFVRFVTGPSKDSKAVLSIYDISGRQRFQEQLNINPVTNDLLFRFETLISGIYLYKVEFDGQVKSGKLVIQ